MRKSVLLLYGLVLVWIMSGCSTPLAGTRAGMSDMQIMIKPESSGETRITAQLDPSIIRDGSWVMFEILDSVGKGPIWLQASYDGNGTYTTTATLPSKGYTLLGHFYAAGGFHFSRQYDPELNSNSK